MSEFYINQYGVKTSKKLDLIKDKAYRYMYSGKGYNINKFNSKTMAKLRIQFEKQADLIGGLDYSLGDSLA